MKIIKNFNKFHPISENVKYHLDNHISFTKNVFRTGSESFYNLLEEVRNLHDNNQLVLEGLDRELFESTDIGRFGIYEGQRVPLDIPMINDIINEKSEYRGRKVDLNKPMRSSGPKKYKVYVRDPKTKNVRVVHFGDAKGGLKAKISDPKARSSFSKRHGCETRHKDKTKPGYWSCRLPRYAKSLGLSGGGNFYW